MSYIITLSEFKIPSQKNTQDIEKPEKWLFLPIIEKQEHIPSQKPLPKKHIETKTPHAYPTIYLPSDRYHPHLAITITVRLIDHLLKLLRGLKDHLVKSPKLWMAIPPLTGILTSRTARGGGGSFKNGNPWEKLVVVNHGWQSKSTDKLSNCQPDELTNWLTDYLTTWLLDKLTNWLFDLLTDWLSKWLTDELTNWLIDRLTNWLTDSLTTWHTSELTN